MPTLKHGSKSELLDGLLKRIMQIGETLSTCCGTTAYCKADAKHAQREALAIVEKLRLPPVLEFGSKIGSNDPIDYWVVSDMHFWHRKILSHHPETRKGDTIADHNAILIAEWNAVVKPDDIVFVLGDFSFGKREETEAILEQLNGRIIWIAGNHDYNVLKSDRYPYHHYFQVVYDGTLVCMMHYPIAGWNGQGRGAVMLHGHSHGSYSIPDPVIFLDIDGVLNSHVGWSDMESGILDGIMFLKPEKYGQGSWVERRLVNRLKQIIQFTGAKVVGVSSWFSSRHDIIETSEFLGIDIIDMVDYTGGGKQRGQSVLDYVTKHNIQDWVIIDDAVTECYDGRHTGHLVGTSLHSGITETSVITALSILRVGDNRRHVSKLGRIVDVGWDSQGKISRLGDMVDLALSRPIVVVDNHGTDNL
jgi:calcineurin-like phosphoesterase family protein